MEEIELAGFKKFQCDKLEISKLIAFCLIAKLKFSVSENSNAQTNNQELKKNNC